jgi:hypothetical protein
MVAVVFSTIASSAPDAIEQGDCVAGIWQIVDVVRFVHGATFASVSTDHGSPYFGFASARLVTAIWDAFRKGDVKSERAYPVGSLGEAYDRFRKTKTWLEKAADPRGLGTRLEAHQTDIRRCQAADGYPRGRRHLVRCAARYSRRA